MKLRKGLLTLMSVALLMFIWFAWVITLLWMNQVEPLSPFWLKHAPALGLIVLGLVELNIIYELWFRR